MSKVNAFTQSNAFTHPLKTLEESEESYKLLQDAVRYPHSLTHSLLLTHSLTHSLNSERQTLRSKVDTLELKLKKLVEGRSAEYANIVFTVTAAVTKEFENIKLNLKF